MAQQGKKVVADWNGTIIAESTATIMVEGCHYFPPDSIKKEYFKPNSKTTVCPWKGTANYYDVTVNGKTNAAAAWSYNNPKDAAKNIKGYYSFWNGIETY